MTNSSLDDDVYFGREYKNRNEITVKLNVKYSCLISGFRREGDENRAPVGYCATSSGNSLTTFRGNIFVPFSGYPEDGTDKLSQNVGKKLTLLVA